MCSKAKIVHRASACEHHSRLGEKCRSLSAVEMREVRRVSDRNENNEREVEQGLRRKTAKGRERKEQNRRRKRKGYREEGRKEGTVPFVPRSVFEYNWYQCKWVSSMLVCIQCSVLHAKAVPNTNCMVSVSFKVPVFTTYL